MDQQITSLSVVDPMMDNVTVLVRCISLWKSFSKGQTNQPWACDVVIQDPEGNRIQAHINKDNINRFMPLLDEGSCYKIGNFGIIENGGMYPLLNHRFKINFFKSTSVTRVNHFDQNLHGFKFEPFQNFKTKQFGPSDLVDVIGTIVSISNLLPFESKGKEKYRRTVILQDIDGQQLECCFYETWAEKFNHVAANEMDSTNPVVMILQLAKVKYFQDKASVSNCLFSTKLWINDSLPEIEAFKQRYQATDVYKEQKHAISLYTPVKKEITVDEFFSGGVKKMVGSIRESGYEYDAIVYANIHKIHRENGWTYLGCKMCGTRAKQIDPANAKSVASGSSSSKKMQSAKKPWWCKKCEKVVNVVPKYKVIVRVSDGTGNASLLLFDDMIDRLVGIPCYKLKDQYGPTAEDIFPDELSRGIVGKRLLFRFTYSEYNIHHNNHVYQVNYMSDDAEFIAHHKKDFIQEKDENQTSTQTDELLETSPPNTDVFQTPAPTTGAGLSKFRYQESLPFNIEDTPIFKKGTDVIITNAGNEDNDANSAGGVSGGSEKRKIVFIDLDEYDEEEAARNRKKRPLLEVKIEKP